jgi:hypothetical protein
MRAARLALAVLVLIASAGSRADGETVTSTLTLDSLSRISYGTRAYAIPSGSKIRLRCAPSTDGAVAIRIHPADARLRAVDLEQDGGQLRFELADEAKGFMRIGSGGEIEAEIDAVVRVTVTDDAGHGVAGRIPVRLTTGFVEAWSADGGHPVEVEGMPTDTSSRGIQLVGSATAGDADPVAPGAAVHVVLSGALDRVPRLK